MAVVTASSAGIGLATVRRLAQEGATVLLSSRKQGNVDEAVEELQKEGLKVHGCVCHVSDKNHRQRLINEAVRIGGGKIDILVSNAAVNPVAVSLMEMPEWAIDKHLDINIKSAILLVKEAAPHFTKDASVVIISSYVGYNPGVSEFLSMYAVTKTALLGLTKVLASELGPRGVRVNGVAPGTIPTKLAAAMVENKEITEEYLKGTYLNRLGTVDEIAGVVSFLCSKDAGYITGETIVAAGGTMSRL